MATMYLYSRINGKLVRKPLISPLLLPIPGEMIAFTGRHRRYRPPFMIDAVTGKRAHRHLKKVLKKKKAS